MSIVLITDHDFVGFRLSCDVRTWRKTETPYRNGRCISGQRSCSFQRFPRFARRLSRKSDEPHQLYRNSGSLKVFYDSRHFSSEGTLFHLCEHPLRRTLHSKSCSFAARGTKSLNGRLVEG